MMIMEFLHDTWDKPPPEMSVELPYADLLERCGTLVQSIQKELSREPESRDSIRISLLARELYILVPGIINVALNYKICLYYQLPLHPTQYFEVPEQPEQTRYTDDAIMMGEKLFQDAIALSLSLYRLSDSCLDTLHSFKRWIPEIITNFVYTSQEDAYTWKGSDPETIKKLAQAILQRGRPSLIVGAAHGALMAGLALALYLDVPLWFLRFSMFKRKDKGPVLTKGDMVFLSQFKGKDVLVFDEDSASGVTLKILAQELTKFGLLLRTGAVIRHGSAQFKPDHVGKVWWE